MKGSFTTPEGVFESRDTVKDRGPGENAVRRRKRTGPATTTVAVLVAASIAFPVPAGAVDPVTIAVIAGAALSAMNKPKNVSGAQLEEIMNMLSGLGASIDTVQGSLATLLVRTSDLDRKMTDSVRKALGGMKLDSVIARVNTLKHLVRESEEFGGGTFERDGRDKWPEYRRDIRRIALELNQDREQLAVMPVSDVPGLIAAVYTELYANQIAGYADGNKKVREIAVLQLEKMLDEKVADSFPRLEKKMLSDISDAEASVANLLGVAGDKVTAGTRHWFSHTLRRKTNRGTHCLPGHRIGPSPDLWTDGPCHQVVDDDPIHTRTWSRQVIIAPADASPDLYMIDVNPVPPTQAVPGTAPGATAHYNPDGEYEAGIFADKRLADALKLHRLRVQALTEIRRLEGLVRRTIGALSQDTPRFNALTSENEAAALIGRASVALADIETERSRQQTERDIKAMEEASKNFHKIEKEGRERIAALVADNRSKAWMSDLQTGLSLFIAAYPVMAEFATSMSHPVVMPSEPVSSIKLPEPGSQFSRKAPQYSLGLEVESSSSRRDASASVAAASPLSPVALGNSVRPTVQFSLLGPAASRAYSLGVGQAQSRMTPTPEQITAAWIDSISPSISKLPATGDKANEQAFARVASQLRGYDVIGQGGSLWVDDVKLGRALMGEEGVKRFIMRQVEPAKQKLDDVLLEYQSKKIAGTLASGDRDRFTWRVADLYSRLIFREEMIGLKPRPGGNWRPPEIVAKEIIRGLDAPASLSRTEEQHNRLVDRVSDQIQKHPHGPYGAKSRDEVDWELRYAGELLPHGVRSQSNSGGRRGD